MRWRRERSEAAAAAVGEAGEAALADHEPDIRGFSLPYISDGVGDDVEQSKLKYLRRLSEEEEEGEEGYFSDEYESNDDTGDDDNDSYVESENDSDYESDNSDGQLFSED